MYARACIAPAEFSLSPDFLRPARLTRSGPPSQAPAFFSSFSSLLLPGLGSLPNRPVLAIEANSSEDLRARARPVRKMATSPLLLTGFAKELLSPCLRAFFFFCSLLLSRICYSLPPPPCRLCRYLLQQLLLRSAESTSSGRPSFRSLSSA